MMLIQKLVILLLTFAPRFNKATICQSLNCSYKHSNQGLAETFQYTLGFKKEFEDFQRDYGVQEKYEHNAAENILDEKPTLTSIKLHSYIKTENITRLCVGIAIPGDREHKALYMRFSSSDDSGNSMDTFYHAFPEKYLFQFTTSERVKISNLLCLSGLRPQPVSYSILLTLYPRSMPQSTIYPRSMPQSTIYYVSFSKDNLAVAISLYPKETSITVLFDPYSNDCVIRVFLCRKVIDRDCEVIKEAPHVSNRIASHTFTDVSPGKYFAKVEQHCPGGPNSEENTISFFMQSPLIEIPDLLQLKLSSNIKREVNDDSSRNVPFVVIGCLLALVLLIVMYIALRKKVSIFSSFFKRNRHESRNQEDVIMSDIHNHTQNPGLSLNPSNPQRVSQTSIYSDVSENSVDPEQISMINDEQLRKGLTGINEMHYSDYYMSNLHYDDDTYCPVHGLPNQDFHGCVHSHC
uniref:Uncharacterized protein LOC111106393 isoform X2 n=1 Tax=Crassostrea virginica TaxID=6565 RepID=A0A8B8B025_CRAVI|nr:uncharacterized protein LOC111106393 isoform X2 [Crassostrea virginica]